MLTVDSKIALAGVIVSGLTLVLLLVGTIVGVREWRRQHAAKALDSLAVDSLRSLAELEAAISRFRSTATRERVSEIELHPPFQLSQLDHQRATEEFKSVRVAAARVGPCARLCHAVAPAMNYCVIERILMRVEELEFAIDGYYYVQGEKYADRMEANEGYAQSAGKWRTVIFREGGDPHGAVLQTEFREAYEEISELLIRP